MHADYPTWTMYSIDLREWETDALPAIVRAYPGSRIADSLLRLVAHSGEHVTIESDAPGDVLCINRSDPDLWRPFTGWASAAERADGAL